MRADRPAGPTGKYPQGKLDRDDDGELRFRVGADHANRLVHIDFGVPTTWLALPPRLARVLADMLRVKADEVEVIEP